MTNRAVTVSLGLFAVIVAAALIGFAFWHKPAASACAQTGQLHVITIKDNQASSTSLTAPLCDQIEFVNQDNVTREIAFGPHENHVPYDGIAERFLNQGQSFTITLNAAGSYHWHDHLHDEIEGGFNVTR